MVNLGLNGFIHLAIIRLQVFGFPLVSFHKDFFLLHWKFNKLLHSFLMSLFKNYQTDAAS